MSRTFHASRDSRRTERAARRQKQTEIIALSYSGDPSPITFGPHAGEMARVGIDAQGRFRIVPVSQIIARTHVIARLTWNGESDTESNVLVERLNSVRMARA